MWFVFALATVLIWRFAELFYKKGAGGAGPDGKYVYLKTCIGAGAVMGIHAVFTLLTQDINYGPIKLPSLRIPC